MSLASRLDGGHGGVSVRAVAGVLSGLLVVSFALPFVAFIWHTGSASIGASLADPVTRTAIRNSLLTAPVATAIATALGVPLAYVLARASFRGKRVVEAIVFLPLVVPPVVGGAMVLSVVGRFTPLGSAAASIGVPLSDSLCGVVLAQTFVAAPFVVITARAGFGAIDEQLEEASRSLGHGPLSTFRRVSLPLARDAIVAGIALTFARATGEFGATMMVAYNPRTMPTQLWVAFITGGIDAVVPLALVLLAVTLAVVALLRWVTRVPTVVEA